MLMKTVMQSIDDYLSNINTFRTAQRASSTLQVISSVHCEMPVEKEKRKKEPAAPVERTPGMVGNESDEFHH